MNCTPTLTNLYAQAFQQLSTDVSTIFDGHTARVTVCVRAGAEQQIMFVDVFEIGFNDFTAVVGMIDFDAIDGNLSTHLVEQRWVIEGEAALTATGMSDEANSPATMGGIDGFGHIGHDRAETGLSN